MNIENFGKPVLGRDADLGTMLLGMADDAPSLVIPCIADQSKCVLVVSPDGDAKVSGVNQLRDYFWDVSAIARLVPEPSGFAAHSHNEAVPGTLYMCDGKALIGGRFGSRLTVMAWLDLSKHEVTQQPPPYVSFPRWRLVTGGAGADAITLFSFAPKAGAAKAMAFTAV